MMKNILRAIVHAGGCVVLLWLVYEIIFNNGAAFGADPVKELIHFLGWTAIVLLMILFLLRILLQIFRQNTLLAVHRPLGLWALFFMSLHIIAYAVFELGLNFRLLLTEVVVRPYLLVGMLAFICFVAASVVTIPALKKHIGRRWFSVHQFVIVGVVAATIHYYWSLKGYALSAVLFLAFAGVILCWKLYQRRIMKLIGA